MFQRSSMTRAPKVANMLEAMAAPLVGPVDDSIEEVVDEDEPSPKVF